MRANQPMGLSPAADSLILGLVRVRSDRFYEGYWDEHFPLADYVAPGQEMSARLAARAELVARLAALDAEIEADARAMVAAREHTYSEYEQATLYSSGPVMFLALRAPDGEPVASSLWSECGMEAASEGRCYCKGELCVPGCPEGCSPNGQEPADDGGPDDEGWSPGPDGPLA